MTPKRKIVPVFVPHVGCGKACVFCDQNRISGAVCVPDADEIEKVLRAAAEKTDAAELAYYGGSFTSVSKELQQSLLEAAQPFLKSGFLTAIRVSARPDGIDPERLALLKAYGVKTVELGAQSMDERVLKESGRGHSAADTRRAVRLTKEAGFRVILQQMTGLPGADEESDLNSAREIAELRPDGVRIYPTVIIRGTPLERLWREGRYRAHTVWEAMERCPDLVIVYRNAGIPILRLGLNPTEELSGGAVAAGAYDPALGERIYGRLLYLQVRQRLLEDGALSKKLSLIVDSREIGRMTGRKRSNLLALQMEFGLSEVRVRSGNVPPGTVAIRKEV